MGFLGWVAHKVWMRSDAACLAKACLASMTRQLGGSVVIPVEELDDAAANLDVAIERNDDPEGVRIWVKGSHGEG